MDADLSHHVSNAAAETDFLKKSTISYLQYLHVNYFMIAAKIYSKNGFTSERERF